MFSNSIPIALYYLNRKLTMRTILLLVALALLALTISANVHVNVDVEVASPHHVNHHRPEGHHEHNDVMPMVEPAEPVDEEEQGEEVVGSGKPAKPIKHVQEKKKTVHKKTESCGQKAIARAMEWVNAKLQYCQSAYGERDYDSSCSSVCHRQSHPEWNKYRSDCSGLASWAYGLSAPGLTTYGFAPFSTAVSSVIEAADLKEGDAVNNADHIMLFKEWITHGKEALFLEEPGCSANPPHARETKSAVTISGHSIHVAENNMEFTAIRKHAC